MSKLNPSRVVLRQSNKPNARGAEKATFAAKNYASTLTHRLQDRKEKFPKTYTHQSFESIVDALIQVYESEDTGIFIIENINQLLASKTEDVFQHGRNCRSGAKSLSS